MYNTCGILCYEACSSHCYHLASEFMEIQLEHNCREANMVAHELARLARGSDQQVWLDEPPNSIVYLFWLNM
jgi:hypothetical protein